MQPTKRFSLVDQGAALDSLTEQMNRALKNPRFSIVVEAGDGHMDKLRAAKKVRDEQLAKWKETVSDEVCYCEDSKSYFLFRR